MKKIKKIILIKNKTKKIIKKSAFFCPKHLLNKKTNDLKELIKNKFYFRAITILKELTENYHQDDDVIRLASIILFKCLIASPSTRNNNILQKIFDKVENNFNDPILNAYTMGILLLIDTPNDDETILKLALRSAKLSKKITLNVIDSLPKNKKESYLGKKIYEYILQ